MKTALADYESDIAPHAAEAAKVGVGGGPAATWFKVTSDEGELAGFASARASSFSTTVAMFILPAFQRQGMSELLSDHIAAWAAEKGIGELLYQVSSANAEWILKRRPEAYVIARAASGLTLICRPVRPPAPSPTPPPAP